MILPYMGVHPKIDKSVFICEGAQIIGDVVLAKDVSVWFNAVVRGDVHYIRVGQRTNIQDCSILHCTYQKHPLNISNDVTIGHGAILHGCTVKNHVLIGMGAKLLDGCVIGENSFIGAGTLVKEHFQVPPGVLVAGLPGKIIRDLRPDEIDRIKTSAEHYLMYVRNYMESDKVWVTRQAGD